MKCLENEVVAMPKVSVIMGIYNCEAFLSRAVESILAQTFSDWELIMCDDGSEDRTYDIARHYAEQYHNIILLRNERNKKLAYSLNKCLELASGVYIARMDADDICVDSRFEKQVEWLDRNPEFEVVGSSVFVYDEKSQRGIRQMPEFPFRMEIWTGVPFVHPSVMMRRAALEELKGYSVSWETARAEDLDLWYRIREAGYKGYNIQEPLCHYHESKTDWKKRKLKYAVGAARLIYKHHRILQLPRRYDYICLKPVISALLPSSMMFLYHDKRLLKVDRND